jgi:hypothetical protein
MFVSAETAAAEPVHVKVRTRRMYRVAIVYGRCAETVGSGPIQRGGSRPFAR